MRKRTAVIIMFLVAAIFFCGCVKKQETVQIKKIKVILDWVPNTNHTGLYVADALGYFGEEGLEVEILQPTEGGSADLIAANQGEFGISYQEQVTYARTSDNPLPIISIAAIIQHNTSGFASPTKKGIVSPKDFEGKKYGGWGSPMEEAVLKGVMEKYGADFSKLEMIDIGALDFFTAVSRDVDFQWIFEGWDGVMAKLKNYPINFIRLQDIDPKLDFYTPVIITNEALVKDNPELVKAFLRAVSKGYEYCIENPQESAKILVKAVPEIDQNLAIESQKFLSSKYRDDAKIWGEMKEQIWSDYSDWMFENGLINKKLDINEAYTNEYLPR